MIDLSHLAWPFFDDSHREFAATLDQWACKNLVKLSDHSNVDQTCRLLVRALGQAGWLRTVVPAGYGGSSPQIDLRKLCLAREILAWHDGLADFAFAMQGLGSASISLFGSDALKTKYLPGVCAG
ncbi:MAG: acyl-CoA dehydrogenase family protein, partial [Xanthobacteraceae bacterium]